MSDEIKVTVVKYPDRDNLVLRYIDPLTGRQKTKTAGTANEKQALKEAGKWQDELREGRYHAPTRITWQAFQDRYEADVLPGHAETTGEKIMGIFDTVTRILNPLKLTDLTADRLSHFQAVLRKNGLSENTIAGHLSHLKGTLNWAVRMGMIRKAPEITMPKRAKGTHVMKGRPITGEEFDRMLDKVPEMLGPAADDWKDYLTGLWLSGLRLAESLMLTWDDDSKLRVDLSGEYPMLRIPAELEKGNKDRLLPITPDFGEWLLNVPEAKRTGFVFNPRSKRRADWRLDQYQVSQRIGWLGKEAMVKVHTDPRTGRVKYASAHDLRRSFGERWASRVMPQVLMELMRHESIDTTLRFYVGRNAQTTAKAIWSQFGNKPGNKAANPPSSSRQESDANADTETTC